MATCRFLLFCLFTGAMLNAHTQQRPSAALPKAENTFALIIGISAYEVKSLSLNYAHRDAEEFALYLRSQAGGSIPGENITLLLDSNAKTASIYSALRSLKKKVEFSNLTGNNEKCMVYIYFSGHGDVETGTRANLGFLLAYNTPRNNYINNAVRIEDLNDYAHTLSADLNANVVLITDACHSGKLAGSDFRGSYLAGTALSKARDQEIRIASCSPEELSKEDERWGNGRGVFSWYLVNGLKGLADANGDQLVTLSEAQRYVDSAIAADALLKEMNHKQTPVLRGNQQFKLAAVNTTVRDSTMVLVMAAPLVSMEEELVFPWKDIEQRTDELDSTLFNRLSKEPADSIPAIFLRSLLAMQWPKEKQVQGISKTLEEINNDSEARRSFAEKLVELLHSGGQQVINAYLSGDVAELERRRYYNSKINGYDRYADMFSTALKLVDPDDPMHHILSVNQLYFSGIAMRLKMPLVDSAAARKLQEEAIALQLKALAMDDNAAYIHNELGILFLERKDLAKAEQHFITATELAPSWVLPQSNLCGLYLLQKNTEKAEAAAKEAERLQPASTNTQLAIGSLEEHKGNYLFAEENYRQAIALNSRHYYPFERLAYLYLNNTQYGLADSFFHEAALRKKGYHFYGNEASIVNGPVPPEALGPAVCFLDTAILDKRDIMGFFYWAVLNYKIQEYESAERVFKKIIAIDATNPLAFHYLGKVYYEQRAWEKAELMFTLAKKYHMDQETFDGYCDSLVRSARYSYVHDCFESFFRRSNYEAIDNYFFLARTYEEWGHYEEAETWSHRVIEAYPREPGGYMLLWQLEERREDYTSAERTIKSYAALDKGQSCNELNALYRRVIEKQPENSEWPYRLSLLLYDLAMKPSFQREYYDTIIWFPRENREIFIDERNYLQIGNELKWDCNNRINHPGVELVPVSSNTGLIFLPGTRETRFLAPAIITPRKDAIYYLRLADSLQPEPAIKAAINLKTGNVFLRAGSPAQAFPHYARSVELAPENASVRGQLVDVSKTLYKHRTGFEQLNYLYDSAQINFTHRQLFAEWSLRAGKPAQARKVINEAKTVSPFPVAQAEELTARSWIIEKNYTKAIAAYKELAARDINNASYRYTLARLYALTGNKTEAWKMLEAALLKGFNNKYLVNTDMALQPLRTQQTQWTALVKKMPEKFYDQPYIGNEPLKPTF